MDINIREAQTRDAPAIVQLIRELAATSSETSTITETYVREYLAAPTSTILLAESQQEVIGLLSYSLRPDLYHAGYTGTIEELIVHESARGRGIGSKLLTELISRLTDMKCAEVSVAVMPDNTEAIRFYRRHGLVEEATFLERHFGCPEGEPLTIL